MSEEHQEYGLVTAVSHGMVTVEIQRGGACKSCAMRGMCFTKSTPAVFHLNSALPLKTGDLVELEISPTGRIMASLLIFGLPILFLFAGFIIASIWFNELTSISLAFTSMAFSFLVLKYCDPKLGSKISVEIVRKIEDKTE